MNLRQAYDGWSQQEQNRQLYVKTRDAFRRAWFTLPTNKPCSWYTKDVLALALAETRVVESDKVKSASVMLHVLTWANFAEPKYNPKPDFKLEDVTRLIHLPADELEKERQRINAAMLCQPMPEEKADEDNKATATEEPAATPDNDADPLKGIDFDDKKQVADALMEQSARIMNDKPENNETNMEKEKKPRGKQPRQICQIDPDTLQVVKTYDSCTEGCRTVGVKNLDRAIKRLQKAGGFYWQYPEDVSTFADRLKQKQDAQQPAVTEQPSTPSTLADFTDDELMTELDRRGFEGELSRRVVFAIGAK